MPDATSRCKRPRHGACDCHGGDWLPWRGRIAGGVDRLELQGKLAAAASRRGVSVEVLAREALECAVDYDDWFLGEVETGLAQVDAGQTLTHDAVGERMAKQLAEHDARR